MVAAAAAGLGQAAVGLVQTGIGLVQSSKARRELEGLEQPFYKIQNELFQNRNLAAQQAQLGVPQATMDYMTGETQRGLGTSVSALRQAGGSANNVSDLFAQYQRGIQQNAAMDAQQRVANLGSFLKENQEIAGQKTMQWTINEFQPFQNKTAMLQNQIAQGNQMMGAGISGALGGAAAYGTATQNQDLIAQLKALGQPQPQQAQAPIQSYQQVQSGINQQGLQTAMNTFRTSPELRMTDVYNSRNVYGQPNVG